MIELVQHHVEPRFCVASHGCLAIAVWGRPSEAEDIERLSAAQRELVREHGHCLSLSIVRVGLEFKVGEGVREAGQRSMLEFAATNRGVALIVEAGGFRTVFLRSVLMSVQVLTRAPVKQRVFEDIGEGVRWLAARPGIDPAMKRECEELIAAVHAFADTYGLPV